MNSKGQSDRKIAGLNTWKYAGFFLLKYFSNLQHVQINAYYLRDCFKSNRLFKICVTKLHLFNSQYNINLYCLSQAICDSLLIHTEKEPHSRNNNKLFICAKPLSLLHIVLMLFIVYLNTSICCPNSFHNLQSFKSY